MENKVKKLLIVLFILALESNASPFYQKCIACHGQSGEKSALNVSAIIKDIPKADFIAAMKGYKKGSYGKAKKALMKIQVANLSDQEIEEIATYITKK